MNGGRWLVVGHVESQNSYGARVRTAWVCRVAPGASGRLELEFLGLDGKVVFSKE